MSIDATISYHVAMAFDRDEAGDLVALEAIAAKSASDAIAKARALAATKAGAVAFSRSGDPMLGEFSDARVLFKAGEIPDEILADQ